MFRQIRWLTLTTLLSVALYATPSWAAKKKISPILETGDQATTEIAQGFFMDSEVGLLTYLVTDGSFVYKPGILVSIRLGGHINNMFSVYGKVGATVTGNTTCYANASRCPAAASKFPTATNPNLRAVPRQGVSLIAGIGARWYYLKLADDRFRLHLALEALFHFIPADNLPEDRLARLSDADKQTLAKHLNPTFGIGVGIGTGFEYFFILKHFSFGVNIIAYYFATEFMPGSMVGLSLLASADIKYTFW